MEAKNRLIVALDVDTLSEAENLVSQLYDVVGMFKVGMQLFYSEGTEVLELINRYGAKIFLDLKLLDIPNTVASAARVLTRYGTAMIDVHTFGGKEMMASAVESSKDEAVKLGVEPPKIIGVTVLTSVTADVLKNEIGLDEDPEKTVIRWSNLAVEAGLDGVVASAREAQIIKSECSCELIVTPGIRPAWAAGSDDQKRILTPEQALNNGASHLVVGRPITKAENPRESAIKIVQEIDT